MNVGTRTLQCGLVVHQVLGTDADGIKRALKELLGAQSDRPFFPGPNPVSIDRGDFDKLRSQPYHITEKTDGMRVGMLACTYKDLDVCALFDRTMSFYLFSVEKMPRALWQGTVFDGELVYDNVSGSWVFLIFDAVVVAGVPTFSMAFSGRLAAAKKSLGFYEHQKLTDTAELRVKRFFDFSAADLPEFDRHSRATLARYGIDGIIFMPEFAHVIYGRHDYLFKLKQHHSLDFLVKKGKLYIFDESTRRNKLVGVPSGPHAALAVEGAIVECTLDPGSGKKCDVWHVVTVRQDKTHSNNKYTFDKTLLNMQENLQLQEIAQATL